MKYPADYQAKPNILANKVILVTGAGDGIGKATAIAAAEHGATVVLVGKTVSKLEATYDEIEKLGAPTPAIYPILPPALQALAAHQRSAVKRARIN